MFTSMQMFSIGTSIVLPPVPPPTCFPSSHTASCPPLALVTQLIAVVCPLAVQSPQYWTARCGTLKVLVQSLWSLRVPEPGLFLNPLVLIRRLTERRAASLLPAWVTLQWALHDQHVDLTQLFVSFLTRRFALLDCTLLWIANMLLILGVMLYLQALQRHISLSSFLYVCGPCSEHCTHRGDCEFDGYS